MLAAAVVCIVAICENAAVTHFCYNYQNGNPQRFQISATRLPRAVARVGAHESERVSPLSMRLRFALPQIVNTQLSHNLSFPSSLFLKPQRFHIRAGRRPQRVAHMTAQLCMDARARHHWRCYLPCFDFHHCCAAASRDEICDRYMCPALAGFATRGNSRTRVRIKRVWY